MSCLHGITMIMSITTIIEINKSCFGSHWFIELLSIEIKKHGQQNKLAAHAFFSSF